jgi:polar amino acid transport system substrate-binding protein
MRKMRTPDIAIVGGRFSTIPHAAAVPAGREAAAAWLRDFVEDAKASGLVERAIGRSAIRGVVVAPPDRATR